MRLALLALVSALGFAAAVPARAEYEAPACRGFFPNGLTGAEFEAAEVKLAKCQSDFMAVAPIAQRAARGEDVLRAYVSAGERSLTLFIEYVRAGNERPFLDVRVYYEGKPRLTTQVSDAAFLVVRSRWAAQAALGARGEAAYAARKAREDHKGIETVCLPGGEGTTVETAHAGHVEHVDLDACKPWEYQFARFLLAHALNDSGDCAAQPHKDDADNYDRLLACVMRRHDR